VIPVIQLRPNYHSMKDSPTFPGMHAGQTHAPLRSETEEGWSLSTSNFAMLKGSTLCFAIYNVYQFQLHCMYDETVSTDLQQESKTRRKCSLLYLMMGWVGGWEGRKVHPYTTSRQ